MAFEITGKIYRIFPAEQKTASFQAREFVLEIASGNYAEYVKFQTVQERCQLLDGLQEGDVVRVSFDLRGREWNGKFFTNLNAWRIERAEDSSGASSAQTRPAPDPFPDHTAAPPATNVDDLPF